MQQAPGARGQAPGAQGQAPGARGQAPGGQGAAGGRASRAPAPEVPPEFNADPIMKLDQPALIRMIQSASSTYFQKAIACKRLSMIGTAEAVPALAALLGDEKLGHYARFGLEPMPEPAVDVALRDALGKLKGMLLQGVINSLGVRRDAGAVAALGGLMGNSDVGVARAAAAALGAISGPEAAKLLTAGLGRASAQLLPVMARAALVCADRLPEVHHRTAVDMYKALAANNMPKPVILAARQRIMAEGI